MKALTLIQPWAWAVCHAGKRVENRTWRPPLSVIGRRIAIHAGAKFDFDDAKWLRNEMGVPAPIDDLPAKAIVAVASLDAVVDPHGAMRPPGWTEQEMGRWAFGPWCWVLADVVVLPQPVPCRGAQGLWDVPADVERAVLAQLSQSH